eukprot:TRINITY_DN8025_c1_g1_i1.p2 TRINITY_DN8025_c1_g1~~TRINITY_DN8025_c1_g1_i1.p2  ORF type:complete len:406 (+),score=139.73 TRINITY_DN8025_c1_g1_i1:161-1219(+)
MPPQQQPPPQPRPQQPPPQPQPQQAVPPQQQQRPPAPQQQRVPPQQQRPQLPQQPLRPQQTVAVPPQPQPAPPQQPAPATLPAPPEPSAPAPPQTWQCVAPAAGPEQQPRLAAGPQDAGASKLDGDDTMMTPYTTAMKSLFTLIEGHSAAELNDERFFRDDPVKLNGGHGSLRDLRGEDAAEVAGCSRCGRNLTELAVPLAPGGALRFEVMLGGMLCVERIGAGGAAGVGTPLIVERVEWLPPAEQLCVNGEVYSPEKRSWFSALGRQLGGMAEQCRVGCGFPAAWAACDQCQGGSDLQGREVRRGEAVQQPNAGAMLAIGQRPQRIPRGAFDSPTDWRPGAGDGGASWPRD